MPNAKDQKSPPGRPVHRLVSWQLTAKAKNMEEYLDSESAQREYQEEIKRREELCRSMGREPGPFGCLCRDLYHHIAGSGCCICNPDAS